MDHLARGFEVGALAEIVAAEADRGHAQPGAAEITNFHETILWDRRGVPRIVTSTPRPGKVPFYRQSRMAMSQNEMSQKKRSRSDAATDGDRSAKI
ncbi:hypothetical protein BEL01nite_52510 [Bradyrhizobium elkanii]|nr:hypothetical protein BEL01nite_52510 [Bradyrhizobium elkanii]